MCINRCPSTFCHKFVFIFLNNYYSLFFIHQFSSVRVFVGFVVFCFVFLFLSSFNFISYNVEAIAWAQLSQPFGVRRELIFIMSPCEAHDSGHCLNWSSIINIYIPVITLHLSIVAKQNILTITQLRSLKLLIAKTPLLHMLYYMNWLTYEIWTRTGGCEFDRSHGAATSSPSFWQQVEEQAPKPMGWMMRFILMTFVPVQKLGVYIYIYIWMYAFFMRFLL